MNLARAADVGVRRSLTTSFASQLVKNFNVSTIKIFFTFLLKVAAERGISVPNTVLQLKFVNFGHPMMGDNFRRDGMLIWIMGLSKGQ